jgi:FtsZ-binding cell division protein ZapB
MRVEEIVTLCLFGVLPLVVIACFCICALIEHIKIKKYEKKYPELFELIEQRNEMQSSSCEFWNKHIAPKINRIDYIIREQKYMSAKTLEQSNIELEELKVEVEKLKEEHDILQQAEDNWREKIESIIKSDKGLLKIMKARGWCREE